MTQTTQSTLGMDKPQCLFCLEAFPGKNLQWLQCLFLSCNRHFWPQFILCETARILFLRQNSDYMTPLQKLFPAGLWPTWAASFPHIFTLHRSMCHCWTGQAHSCSVPSSILFSCWNALSCFPQWWTLPHPSSLRVNIIFYCRAKAFPSPSGRFDYFSWHFKNIPLLLQLSPRIVIF